jgi:hypothetical protein
VVLLWWLWKRSGARRAALVLAAAAVVVVDRRFGDVGSARELGMGVGEKICSLSFSAEAFGLLKCCAVVCCGGVL